MLIERPNAEIFAGFNPTDIYVSELAPKLLEGARVSSYYRNVSNVVSGSTMDCAALTSRVVGLLSLNVGLPSYDLAALESFFDAAWRIAGGIGVDWKSVLKKQLGSVLELLQSTLSNMLTAIPIVGWVVDLALALWDYVEKMRSLWDELFGNKEPPPPEGIALVYDKPTDEGFANEVLRAQISKLDWTELFMPNVVPQGLGNFSVTNIDYTIKGSPRGQQILISGKQHEGARGFLPGLSGVAGDVYQFAKVRGFVFGIQVEGVGDLLPSMTQLGGTLWASVMKNGPRLWQIDPDRIISAWESYFHELAIFGVAGPSPGRGFDPGEQAQAAAYHTAVWAEKTGRGGTQWVSKLSAFPFESVPDKYKEFPYSYDQIIRFVLEQQWERRLWQSLDTLTCAYISDDFPAVKWAKSRRPKLYARYLERRELLLSHTAVSIVDLQQVRDPMYRARVEQAQSIGPRQVQQRTEGIDTPAKLLRVAGERHIPIGNLAIDRIARVDFAPATAPAIPYYQGRAEPGIGVFVAGAAALGAAWFALRGVR